MGPSLFPWGSWEKPRHDDKRRSHVLGQFPQERLTRNPYQITTPGESLPIPSSALGATHFARTRASHHGSAAHPTRGRRQVRSLNRLPEMRSQTGCVPVPATKRIAKGTRQSLAASRQRSGLERRRHSPPSSHLNIRRQNGGTARSWIASTAAPERLRARRSWKLVRKLSVSSYDRYAERVKPRN